MGYCRELKFIYWGRSMVSSTFRRLMARMFDAKFDEVSDTIGWNRYWLSANGRMTGLFSNPGYKLELEIGRVAKTTDSYGRRAILIGTALGLIVVYQTNAEMKSYSLSIDYDKRIEALGLFHEGVDFDVDTLNFVFGEHDALLDARQFIDEHISSLSQGE